MTFNHRSSYSALMVCIIHSFRSTEHPSTTICFLAVICFLSEFIYQDKIFVFYSSSELISGASPAASSLGNCLGNQPYSFKSTSNSPKLPVLTVTPSPRSTVAWFAAPEGWPLVV